LQERSNHLKAFAYFNDIAIVGITALTKDDHLLTLRQNWEVNRLAHGLSTRQTKTLAAGDGNAAGAP